MQRILIIALSLAFVIECGENFYLRKTIRVIESAYNDFLAREVRGQSLHEVVHPGTLGIFTGKEKTIVCARVELTEAAKKRLRTEP